MHYLRLIDPYRVCRWSLMDSSRGPVPKLLLIPSTAYDRLIIHESRKHCQLCSEADGDQVHARFAHPKPSHMGRCASGTQQAGRNHYLIYCRRLKPVHKILSSAKLPCLGGQSQSECSRVETGGLPTSIGVISWRMASSTITQCAWTTPCNLPL